MGDRYTITALRSEIEARFNVEATDLYRPRYNAAPTQALPVITQGSKGLSFFHWGSIPGWSHNKTLSPKLIFTESEHIAIKASAKRQVMSSRCIVPADGFYGWKRVSKKGKIPYRLTFRNRLIKSFAALWEEFEDEENRIVHTFKLLTVPSNSLLHDMDVRMPVIFDEAQEKIWLSPTKDIEQLTSLLITYPGDQMTSYTVSPRFNDPAAEGPDLIQPFAPADQHGNYSLFD